jgi:hypothetical protein
MNPEVLDKFVYDEDVEHCHGKERQTDEPHIGDNKDRVNPGIHETHPQTHWHSRHHHCYLQ